MLANLLTLYTQRVKMEIFIKRISISSGKKETRIKKILKIKKTIKKKKLMVRQNTGMEKHIYYYRVENQI